MKETDSTIEALIESYELERERIWERIEALEEEVVSKLQVLLEELLPEWGVGLDVGGPGLDMLFASPKRKKESSPPRRLYIADDAYHGGGLLEALAPSIWRALCIEGREGYRLHERLTPIDGIPPREELFWIVTKRNEGDGETITISPLDGEIQEGCRYHGPVRESLARRFSSGEIEIGHGYKLPCYKTLTKCSYTITERVTELDIK